MADETQSNETTDEPQAQVTPSNEDATPKADEAATAAADDAATAEAADVDGEDADHGHSHDGEHDHDHAAPVQQVRGGARAEARRARRSQPAGEAPVVRAIAKYVRTTPRKARLIADLIRDKDVTEARAILAHSTRSAAQDWSKVLESAVANAENNHELIGDDLKVKSVFADDGPTLKRFQPRAQGRAYRINKRTSHLTVQLTPKEHR
ncbi:50S ribosomal protein L22 [Patulibacter sp. S7RM1-6]